MILNHQILGGGEPLVIVHGLLGSLDNWYNLGKKWSNFFKVILLDVRNHGLSDHADEMSYPLMAEDLMETARYLKLSSFHLLGHSVGGKIAMTCATLYSNYVETLHILDIAPKTYSTNHQTILEAMNCLDLSLSSRSTLDKVLAQKEIVLPIRQLILKNLRRNKEKAGFTWKINLKSISDNLQNISGWTDDINPHRKLSSDLAPYLGPSQFLIGEKSNYVQKSDEEKISRLFPYSKIIMVKDAGHWLHAEKPIIVENLVLDFINDKN